MAPIPPGYRTARYPPGRSRVLLGGSGFVGERLPHVPRACLTRLALSQRPAFHMGQMRQLTEYQELVEGIYTQAWDQFQADAQTHPAQKIHRLVKREAAGKA